MPRIPGVRHSVSVPKIGFTGPDCWRNCWRRQPSRMPDVNAFYDERIVVTKGWRVGGRTQRSTSGIERERMRRVREPKTSAGQNDAASAATSRRAAVQVCGWCGRPFDVGRVGRIPKWCLASCRQRAWEQRPQADARLKLWSEWCMSPSSETARHATVTGCPCCTSSQRSWTTAESTFASWAN
jgi:hypothetical protein